MHRINSAYIESVSVKQKKNIKKLRSPSIKNSVISDIWCRELSYEQEEPWRLLLVGRDLRILVFRTEMKNVYL